MGGGTPVRLRLELLGPGRVLLLPEERILEAPPGVLQLLAYLVLRRASPEHRDVVAATLWPDVTDHRARRRLSTSLWRMRSLIESPAEVTLVTSDSAGRLVLDLDASDVDVVRFERVVRQVLGRPADQLALDHVVEAHAVLDECRAEILSGRYDEWLLADRDRLAELRDRLVGHLATWYGRHCEPAVATEAVSELLAADPGNETAHRILIGLYSSAGESALARRQLDRCRRALGDQLGIEPSPITIAAAEPASRSAPGSKDPLEELAQLSHDLARLQQRLVELVQAVRPVGRDRSVTPR